MEGRERGDGCNRPLSSGAIMRRPDIYTWLACHLPLFYRLSLWVLLPFMT